MIVIFPRGKAASKKPKQKKSVPKKSEPEQKHSVSQNSAAVPKKKSPEQNPIPKPKQNPLAGADGKIDYLALIKRVAPPLREMLRKIYVTDLYIDSVVGGSDAAVIAITYGLQSAAINGTLAALGEYISIDAKEVHIEADFSGNARTNGTDFFAHCKVRARTFRLVRLALQLYRLILKDSSKKQNKKTSI